MEEIIGDSFKETVVEEPVIDSSAKQIVDSIVDSLAKIQVSNEKQKFLKDIKKDVLDTNNLDLFYLLCSDSRISLGEEDFKEYSQAVIDSKNPKYNYLFANLMKKGIDRSSHMQVIIESKDPKYNYLSMKKFGFSNRKLYAKSIRESKDPKYNYLAAILEPKKSQPYANVVIKSKNPEYNYKFIVNKDIFRKKVNVFEHERAIIQSKDLKYNYLCLEFCTNRLLLSRHSKIILDSKNSEYNHKVVSIIDDCLKRSFYGTNYKTVLAYEYNREFLKKINKKHFEVLLDNKSIDYLLDVVPGRNEIERQKVSKMILENGDLISNYTFAARYKINVLEHGQVIIDSKDPEYNYEFASAVDGADIQAHAKVVIESKSIMYNYLFAKCVKKSDVDAHRQVILEARKRSFVSENDKMFIDMFLEEFPENVYSEVINGAKKIIKEYKLN